LIEVKTTNYKASDPEEEETAIEKPPKDFGLINLEDFDPDDYNGQGKK
jgi:hypothetical protein